MVTVVVWVYDKKHPVSFLDWLLGGAITFFTGEPYTHVGMYVKGNLYEDTMHSKGLRTESGALKSQGLPVTKQKLLYLKLKQDVNEDRLSAFADGTVAHSMNYSIMKLFLFMLVTPFKRLWKNKVPFPHFKGQTCSVYVDTCLEYAGIKKLVTDEIEKWETPRDFVDSTLFDKIDRSQVV